MTDIDSYASAPTNASLPRNRVVEENLTSGANEPETRDLDPVENKDFHSLVLCENKLASARRLLEGFR